jgi:hypothetical protein
VRTAFFSRCVPAICGAFAVAFVAFLSGCASTEPAPAAGAATVARDARHADLTIGPITLATPFPLYSSYFTGTTPFHQSVAALMSAGATVLPATVATHLAAQGLGNNLPNHPSSGMGPIYIAQSGDPGYTFVCPRYNGCPAAGLVTHYPAGASPAVGSDHHLVSFDPVYLDGEVDGWGGYGCAGETNPVEPSGTCLNPCNLVPGSPAIANCSFGGFSAFSGSGLGNGGNAAGYAYGLFQISAQDLLQGHIDHALGMVTSCLDNGGVFPAARSSDSLCPANLEPSAVYGDLIHLKSSVDVATLGYSPYCAIVVQALQTYGAYTTDTNGSYGISLEFEDPANPIYATNDPWSGIYGSMIAGGDASGAGTNVQNFQSCLQRLNPSDIEVIQIPTTLPTNPLPILPGL